jgi:uncharacterized radical SAM protein YgiQ
MSARGWDEIDVLIVTGDAYVDHPSFGPVLIARHLEALGWRVGIIAQPRWNSVDDLVRMGPPRLFVGVSSGNLDSMLSKLTAQQKVRSEDPYSPGGARGRRPNRAVIVYSHLCRQAFGRVPIVLGGIEASLRRFAHYDYWQNSLRRSVLLDAKADLLVFGMGESAVAEVARRLGQGASTSELADIRGTAHVLSGSGDWSSLGKAAELVMLPSFEAVAGDRRAFLEMTRLIQRESHPWSGRRLLQPHGEQAVLVNPPSLPLTSGELDRLYELPFTRRAHPCYGEGTIPALESVLHSLVTVRGCSGGCAFCSLAEHEGRVAQSRSEDSVVREARSLTRLPGFAGTLTDVGGPTANHYQIRCSRPDLERRCRKRSCLQPRLCRHLDTDHGPLLALLARLRREPAVRHVHFGSGIRHDLALRDPRFVRALARHHTGGQLSVAPEHTAPSVLALMRKPAIEQYERFVREFQAASREAGKDQYLVPYFLVGHPGSTLKDTLELALYLKRHGLRPRQVQEFIPTPMTWATAMYYTGLDPDTGQEVTVTRELREKRQMKALVLYWDRSQWQLGREALRALGRVDLIGSRPACLVPAELPARSPTPKARRSR